MTWPVEAPLDVIRGRVAKEHARADQAARCAERHERAWATAGTEPLRALHERMAATHRKIEERHRTSARLQARYAVRRAGRAAGQPDAPAGFVGAVAAEVGWPSTGITLLGPDMTAASVTASDPLAAAAQSVEFDLGEGPVHDAIRELRTVTAGMGESPDRWPHYSAAVATLGVRSMVAVPLSRDTTCVGALTVFDASPKDHLAALSTRLAAVADSVAYLLLPAGDGVASADGPAGPLLRDRDHRAVIHQAVGMVAAQRDCSVDDALALLRARAFTENEPVDTIARMVVRRTLRFDERQE